MWKGKVPRPLFSAQCRDSCRRGWRINPYTHVRGADLSIQALSTCSTAKQVSLPPNTPLVFLSTIWAQEASVCPANLIQEAQTNICRYSLTKWRPSPPIFRRKKGGGPQNFTDSFAHVILEFSWINKDFSRSKCSRNFPGGFNNDVGVVSAKSVHSRSVHSRYNVHPERYLRSYLC